MSDGRHRKTGHVPPFDLEDGGCKTCAECDLSAGHLGNCDCAPWHVA